MTNDGDTPRALLAYLLRGLASEAEALATTAEALDDEANAISGAGPAQRIMKSAALVKSAALQMTIAAANVVGMAESLRLVAGIVAVDENEQGSGELPS